MATTASKKYTYSLGRRKTSTCKLYLFAGKGENLVNKIKGDVYFPGINFALVYNHPFLATKTEGKFHYHATVLGGGKQGQVEALALAISRGLKKVSEEYRPALRAAGLLTVDSRVRQRRHVGTGGKARRRKQSPKR